MNRVVDSSSLMENIDFLFYESTMPDEILLRGCNMTRGVLRTKIGIGGRSCHIYDVGGRRSERRKWLAHFQDIDAAIFVASLTGYCQIVPPENVNGISVGRADFVPFERPTAFSNQMVESLMLFDTITKLDGFKTVPIVLLLNKYDLLEHYMRRHPILRHYPESPENSDPLTACRFFATKFSALDRRSHGSLTILATSAVEYDDFRSTMDKVWPVLFPYGLTVIPEALE